MNSSFIRKRNPPVPAPTPTPHVGPFVMSVEFPTPKADEPTHRIPYEEVATIEEAVAWIRHPPFPQEVLKKLKKGVLLTARMQAEWVQENGQRGEEIAAMGLVLRVGTRNVHPKIAVVTRDGISVDGEMANAKSLPIKAKAAGSIRRWMSATTAADTLLHACRQVPRPLLTLTACAVARLVLHRLPMGEDRPLVALETAEAWAYGRATLNQATVNMENMRTLWRVSEGDLESVSRSVWGATAVVVNRPDSTATFDAGNAVAWAISIVGNDPTVEVIRRWISTPEVAFAAITEN